MNSLEIIKSIYADIEALPQHLHSDFKLHSPGKSLVAGEFAGLEGMIGHLTHMQTLSDNTMKLQASNFMADEKWGIGVSRITALRDDKQLDTVGFGLWRFADGKLIDHWEFVSDQNAWDDFWS